MLFRPLSFTRNLGGPQKVYDAIRQAYSPGISLTEFRQKLQPSLSRDQSLLVTEFYLASMIEHRTEVIFEDELIRVCRELPLSSLQLRLALFALNLNLPGQRLLDVHRRPAAAQHAYVCEYLYQGDAWQADRLEKPAMHSWLAPRLDQQPEGVTKFRNNYHYLFSQCGFATKDDGTINTFAEDWYRHALRLYLERRQITPPAIDGERDVLLEAMRVDQVHRLLGVSLDWLVSRAGAEVTAYLERHPVAMPQVQPTVPPEEPPVVLPSRRQTLVDQIQRDTQAVKDLKALYGFRCQVCGIRLRVSRDTFYAIGAHIQPLGQPHNGPDVRGNILILCPNHHAEMDAGVISISPEDGITLHHAFEDNTVHERLLTMMPGHVLGRDYLRYHWERLYLPNRDTD